MAACMMIKADLDPDATARTHESTLAAQRRAFAEKILAIQNLDPAQINLEPTKPKKTKPAGFRIRVSKVRTRCSRAHFCDYEEPELTEEERRHALAQKLIAKTLRQADRRRRRRRIRRVKIYPLCVRGWNIGLASFSPLVSYLRWIRRQPWLRWSRMLRKQYSSSRVTCCNADDDVAEPLLPLMTCEGEVVTR